MPRTSNASQMPRLRRQFFSVNRLRYVILEHAKSLFVTSTTSCLHDLSAIHCDFTVRLVVHRCRSQAGRKAMCVTAGYRQSVQYGRPRFQSR